MDVACKPVEGTTKPAVVGNVGVALGAGHGEGVASVGAVVHNIIVATPLDQPAIHSTDIPESIRERITLRKNETSVTVPKWSWTRVAYQLDKVASAVERASDTTIIGEVCSGALGAGHGELVPAEGTVVGDIEGTGALEDTAIHDSAAPAEGV